MHLLHLMYLMYYFIRNTYNHLSCYHYFLLHLKFYTRPSLTKQLVMKHASGLRVSPYILYI